MKFGYDANYLKVMDGEEMLGILCFNLDHSHVEDYRGYIRHLTVSDKDKYTDVVKEAANYIFEELACDSIRVDIHHFKQSEADDAKITAVTFVKDAFSMARKGFKWKTMIN